MSPRKWWVGTSDAPMVALWPDRRQSSPRRSFSSPRSSTWQMAKERAAKQSPGGGCRSTPMPVTEGRATVGTAQWSGAAQGPMTRPSRVSATSSSRSASGGFPRHVNRVLPPKPVEPLRVGVALVGAWPPPGRGADRPQHVEAEVHVLLEVVGRRVTHAPEHAIEHEALKGPGPVLSDVSGAHMRGQGRQPRGGVVVSSTSSRSSVRTSWRMRARSWRHSRRNSRTASSAGSRDGQPTRECAMRAAAAQWLSSSRPSPKT